MNFKFENPSFLYLIVVVILLFIISNWQEKRRQQEMQKAFGKRLLPFLTKSVSLKKRRLKTILQFFSLVFLLVAAARPQFGESKQEVKSQGIEMIIAFDVSNSMMTEDVRPNRLEFAKAELNRFLDLMVGSKIGLVAFAGSAALISPITTDSSSIRLFIETLSTEAISNQGTEFKKALEVSQEAFKRGGQETDPTSKVTRVILIFSDGEDQEAGALDYAESLVKDGVRIFTVAVGTENGGSIPERDNSGYLRGYKKDKSGQTVVSTAKGDALKGLAQKGEGSFYYASFGGDYLKKLADDLNQLEKTEFESQLQVQYEERYQIFLLLSLLLILLEIIISERQAEFRLWKGRFEVPPQ